MCVAVGEHDAVIYEGGSWSPPGQIYPEGNLWGVSCASPTFCAAVTEHFSGGGAQNFGQALTYDGSAWSVPGEIPHAPERGPFSAGSVSCASSTSCVAIPRFEGAASLYGGSGWGAWMPLEVNGNFSSVSCPSPSFCMVANRSGQVLAYSAATAGEPPAEAGQETPGGQKPLPQGTPRSSKPPMSPPIERRKPLVNGKTGEIVLEYEFPEAGNVRVRGEAMGSEYGETRTAIAGAGRYKLRIKPRAGIRAALTQGKTLTVRLAVLFKPAGTSGQIGEGSTVRVHGTRPRRGAS